MKITFVVLHYCLPEVTEDCVRSLLSLDGDKEIVVVDNASPDNSGVILQQFYGDERRVHIILNSKNCGFADGNNLGYRYARNELNSNIIVVLNNDTIIKDKGFLLKLLTIADNSDCHILAPDILTYRGFHQNPYRERGIDVDVVRKKLRKERIKKILYNIPYIGNIFSKKTVKEDGNYCEWQKRLVNIVPHGSAIIFMQGWTAFEDFAFCPGTFMYFEEDLLYYYARSKGYKILYEPMLQIIHLEDMSTNTTHKNSRKRKRFQSQHKVNSLRLLFEVLKTK